MHPQQLFSRLAIAAAALLLAACSGGTADSAVQLGGPFSRVDGQVAGGFAVLAP